MNLNENIKTSNNTEIIDKLCIFQDEKPASRFETGQQKGGKLLLCLVCNSC